MKIIHLTVGLTCLLGACHPDRINIEGNIGRLQENKIYLGEITSEYYGTFDAIDSAEIKDGKFTFILDSVKPQMLFLGFRTGNGGMIFAEPGTQTIKPAMIAGEKIIWEVSGSVLNRKYQEFIQQRDSVCQQKKLDSLNQLFYIARDKGNREEMARIKTESIVYYDRSREVEDQLVKETVEANQENPFGMYLYYSKFFVRKNFSTLEEVNAERDYIHTFGPYAQQTPYKSKMEAQLDLYAACAIGVVAPEICGQDTLGNLIKLSDFRGKYVIVDFWNSYCHWCREETPWLKKALDVFKDKNFTILGVSDDRKKELWLKAIKEDESYWDHLLLELRDPVMKTYCIKGIPHIILVGPDGRILAKEMRHEELTEVPAKFMN